MKELNLDDLRKMAKDARKISKLTAKRAAETNDNEEWDVSRLMLGEAFAYERIIQLMRGLKEREFQIAKKKGTL